MGVQGLWELLAPVGRRVSVETLAGKKLAIDASIWMVQFMKAMRDEKGEMVRNAHLLGFFRRICKLLFLRTRPVFVFDGGTPALKRRTVAARRRHRENARAKIRKTAEKLLLNHLKSKKLEELAAEIKNSRAKDDPKGKRVISDHEDFSGTGVSEGMHERVLGAIDQEGLDEMLAASLAAEEEGKLMGNESASIGEFPSEADFDEDENEEMAIPVIDGYVDPTVLASLPPSMQLDLLVQMRERLMAENRQKYQKIKKSPSKFSEIQIQSYLKTVAFRREIDEVQKFAAVRGPEGVQTSRIASEASREFIFSSSFTGDKTMFTSAGVERNGNAGKTEACTVKESISADSVQGHSSSSQLRSAERVNVNEPAKDFGHDIETYIDERGRTRVSRVRGLGIRMSRDLQRNLDLMREHEIGNSDRNLHKNVDPGCSTEASRNGTPHMDRKEDNGEPSEDINRCHETCIQEIPSNHSCESFAVENEAAIEVSFSMDDIVDRDDDLFSQLVAGSSTLQLSEICSSGKHSNGCETDFDWEDGMIDNKAASNKTGSDNVSQASSEERVISEDDGLNWEEGGFHVSSACSIEHGNSVSRGSLEEESEIQEAIRRSLEDLHQRSNIGSLLQVPVPNKSALDSSSAPLQYDCRDSPSPHGDGAIQDLQNESSQVSNHVFSTQSNNGDGILKKSEIDRVPINALTRMEICQQESCLDTSIDGEDKGGLRMLTDISLPGISDVCVRSTGKAEADVTGHGTVLLDSYKIPEKEVYRNDTSTNDNMELHTESLESTLDEELLLLGRERKDLGEEQRKLERNAESVNNEMFAECQELLQMFGLPFIIAPMEAEAQCAYMELMNLVDGVVTDDSDVFLFGAQNVYKNIFDDRKYVETYLLKDIENELGLSREKLIRMALLLGSDYTEGVSGIGIVNAIEVVHAFPEEDGLKKFREWVESPDPAILGKLYPHIADSAKKKISKTSITDVDQLGSDVEGSLSNEAQQNDVQPSSHDIIDVKKTFMDKHRNVSKNWHIPSSFPSDSVVSAYTKPQVDESTEAFTWGKPDLPLLRKLCWEKFGWANQKADELLVPVLKEYNKHETQLRLEAFYTFNEKFAKIRSQRIKRAVKGITGNRSRELTGDLEQGDIETKKKRRRTSGVEENIYEKNTDGKCDNRNQFNKVKPRKLPSDGGHAKSLVPDESVVNEKNELTIHVGRRRGKRGAQGGVGRRRQSTGRGRERANEKDSFESTETSSSGCSYRSVEERQAKVTCSPELRRSVRRRKHVQYTEDDMDADGCSDSLENRNKILDAPAAAQGPSNQSDSGGDNDDRDMDMSSASGFSGSKNTADTGYLLSGGGFCINDDDDGDLNGNPTQPVPDTEKLHVPLSRETAGALDDQNMDMGLSFNSNPKNIQESIQTTPVRGQETDILTEQELGRQARYGFTAMTSLRRKRK